jgi:hypothetical protein
MGRRKHLRVAHILHECTYVKPYQMQHSKCLWHTNYTSLITIIIIIKAQFHITSSGCQFFLLTFLGKFSKRPVNALSPSSTPFYHHCPLPCPALANWLPCYPDSPSMLLHQDHCTLPLAMRVSLP